MGVAEIRRFKRLEDPAMTRVRYGYRRLPVLLGREGWGVNHKRIYRPYREERLNIRAKTPRRRRAGRYRAGRYWAGRYWAGRAEIEGPNQIWARDFMSDALFDGQAFRILTIVDSHSPESLAVMLRTCFRAYQVTEALDQPIRQRGAPKTLRRDNHPEFAGRALVQWAYWNRVELAFSRPGTKVMAAKRRIPNAQRLLRPRPITQLFPWHMGILERIRRRRGAGQALRVPDISRQ